METPDVGLVDGQFALKGLTFESVDELHRLTLKMPPRRRQFVYEYAIDKNGKQAAIRAGFSPKAAEQEASRLLRDVKVRRALDLVAGRIERKCEVTAERVVRELAFIGFLDIRDAYNADGTLKAPGEMPEAVAKAISGIDVEELLDGFGKGRASIGRTSKVRFWDKRGALELLGKHLKMWTDKTEVSGGMKLEELVAGANEEGKHDA